MEPAMNLSQVQIFQENVTADQRFPNLTANEPPLDMLQEQLLIEADQPLPEIIENSGLEIPFLEKENADQIFTEIIHLNNQLKKRRISKLYRNYKGLN
ncbi:hypothetical protein TNIN_187391 [Trichonephila inaurata madagascariensis]|uniref:Uncharacterized protein n=1 Tax=Trichonephila inaurata madagascariensis TaxID=2747483 RepID=A0A8X6JWY4_9ARAC|nr:hypothetical protein TNIN_187391 [Trichonephila inaurata madagascariensis]